MNAILEHGHPDVFPLLNEVIQSRHARASIKNESGAFWKAVDTLTKGGHPDALPFLNRTLRSPIDPWARALALRSLVQLQGTKCLPLLRESLQDPVLRAAAAAAIGSVARESGDADLVELLRRTGEAARDPGDLGCIARALRAVGGDRTRPMIAPWIHRLASWERTDAAWFVHGIQPSQAIRRLVELGALPRMPDDAPYFHAVAEAETSPGPASGHHVQAAFNSSAGGVRVNAHTLNQPFRYDQLVGLFATARPDFFIPEEARQEQDGKGGYVVRFVHRGRSYRFATRDLGPWYDLPPVLESVNRALADDGIPDRFVGLENGTQIACFVVAVPDVLEAAAKELHLPVEADPDAARKLWLKYQEEAAERPGK